MKPNGYKYAPTSSVSATVRLAASILSVVPFILIHQYIHTASQSVSSMPRQNMLMQRQKSTHLSVAAFMRLRWSADDFYTPQHSQR